VGVPLDGRTITDTQWSRLADQPDCRFLRVSTDGSNWTFLHLWRASWSAFASELMSIASVYQATCTNRILRILIIGELAYMTYQRALRVVGEEVGLS
jgi:hypothetical protein